MPPVFSWILGTSQRWRDDALVEILAGQWSAAGDPYFQMLVPTRRRATFISERLQAAFTASRSRPVWKPAVGLLRDWVERLYDDHIAQPKFRPLQNELEKLICVEQALRQVGTEAQYLPRAEDFPGILRRVSQCLSILKENEIDQEEGRDFSARLMLDEFGNTGARDHDLMLLLSSYSNLMKEHGFLDEQDKTSAVIEWLEKSAPDGFCQTLVVDGFYFLTRQEERLLRALIARSRRVVMTLDTPLSPSELLHDLEEDKPRGLSSRVLKPAQVFWRWAVTQPHGKIIRQPDALSPQSESIEAFSVHNRVEEVRLMARDIKALAQSEAIDLERIQVLFPQIDRYVSIIYEIFPQYGIPFSITRGLYLNSSPIAIVLLSLLHWSRSFQRSDLFRFFSSNLVSFRRPIDVETFAQFIRKFDLGAHSAVMDEAQMLLRYRAYAEEQAQRGFTHANFDIATLDRYARSANIRGGDDLFHDWFLPLDRNYFAQRIRALNPQQADERERLCRNYFLVIRQLYFLQAAIDQAKEFNRVKTAQEVLAAVRDKIDRFSVLGNVVRRVQEIPDLSPKDQMFLLRRDVSAFEAVFTILGELQGAFELKAILQNDEAIESQESPLAFVIRLLTQELAQRAISDPVERGAVRVTETLEVRGVDVDWCFFGGLTADDFPRRKPQDFLLPETPMAPLRQINVPEESRYLFDHLLRNTHKRLVLTYPRVDQSDEKSPSMALEDLKAQGIAIQEAEKRTASKAIYADFELEERLGHAVSGPRVAFASEFAYLLSKTRKPAALHKSLAVELSRWCNMAFGPYDGILDVGDLEKRTYSYTQLEEFASCPQRYYYRRLLDLEPLDELTEEMAADEFGALVHAILERFHGAWMKAGLGGVSDQTIRQAKNLLADTCDAVLGEQKRRLEYVLWDRQVERIRAGLKNDDGQAARPPGLLEAFLQNETTLTQAGFSRVAAEHKFGFEEPLNVAGIQVRGSIDRLDRAGEGFVVFDYKTGKVPKARQLYRGLSFQLPLYLMALQKIYPARDLGAAYYRLKDPQNVGLSGLLAAGSFYDDKSRFGEIEVKERKAFDAVLRTMVTQWIGQIHRQIRQGKFHYAFEDVHCRYCDFRAICRRDEQRLFHLEHRLSAGEAYIPQRNAAENESVQAFRKAHENAQETLAKKTEAKSAKLGSLQAQHGRLLQEAYTALPQSWQAYFASDFKATMQEWRSLEAKASRP